MSGDYFTAGQRRHTTLEARWHIAGYPLVAALSVALESRAVLPPWFAPMLSTKVPPHPVQNITEHAGLTRVPDTVHDSSASACGPAGRGALPDSPAPSSYPLPRPSAGRKRSPACLIRAG